MPEPAEFPSEREARQRRWLLCPVCGRRPGGLRRGHTAEPCRGPYVGGHPPTDFIVVVPEDNDQRRTR